MLKIYSVYVVAEMRHDIYIPFTQRSSKALETHLLKDFAKARTNAIALIGYERKAAREKVPNVVTSMGLVAEADVGLVNITTKGLGPYALMEGPTVESRPKVDGTLVKRNISENEAIFPSFINEVSTAEN